MAKESISRGEDATRRARKAVVAAPGAAGRAWGVARRAGSGVVGVLNVCMVLAALMVLAVVLGVGVVRVWVDEPLVMNELVFFDYTDVNPTAVMEFSGVGVGGGDCRGDIREGKSASKIKPTMHIALQKPPNPGGANIHICSAYPTGILKHFSTPGTLLCEDHPKFKASMAKTDSSQLEMDVLRLGIAEHVHCIAHNHLCCCRHLFFPARTVTISPPSVWRGRTIEDDKVVRSEAGERVADSMSARETSKRRRRSMRRLLMHEFEDFGEQAGSSGFGSANFSSEEASDQHFGSSGFTDSESVCTDG
ncbi:hypothetical protein Syun_006027 [Stephania yunnanensis]|uniref:Uncharacterized protein n=1 Tax=Stephania yunnanensis TaxID=152371 RepID=A0AAP0Q0Y9_9MAGN